MKYTPLDIQRREFERRSFGGLDEGEVRAFLHEVSAEWEEILAENNRLKEEVLDDRERLRQYQEQDHIFRETLLQAQRTREEVLETAKREKELLIREGQFKAEEILREVQRQVVELEVQLRGLRMDRLRLLQDMDAMLDRFRRQIQMEAPELYTAPAPTLNLEQLDLGSLVEEGEEKSTTKTRRHEN